LPRADRNRSRHPGGKTDREGYPLAVEFIIDLLAQGWTEAEILRNYPGLTHEDVPACLGHACAALKAEKVYPIFERPPCRLRDETEPSV
jgi:uncharacterized protein (DUF433 family)